MITLDQINKFEEKTNFPLAETFFEVRTFFSESYPEIINFFKGKTETIRKEHFKALKYLLAKLELATNKFSENKNLFDRAFYWEILDTLEDIKLKLQTTSNSSKFLRSSIVNGSFKSGMAVQYKMNKNNTLEQVSSLILKDTDSDNDWVKIAVENGLKEEDWDIDGGTELIVRKKAFQNNLVTSFIDNTIGERVYGKDINKNFNFKEDDIDILGYKETVQQTVEILAKLTKGDIPENPGIGLAANLYKGVNYSQLNLPSISRELARNFNTDDLFRDFEVLDIKHVEGDIFLDYKINTKYDLVLIKSVTI